MNSQTYPSLCLAAWFGAAGAVGRLSLAATGGATRVSGGRIGRSLASLLLCVAGLAGCATPQAPVPEVEPQYWSMSRTVESSLGMVTLFDPIDLMHHEVDPEDWYRYDFAFANDLETGRFAAVMTDAPGRFAVRLTTGPLSADEQAVAGPQAVMRLRVINHRLLLSGGETWPSRSQSARAYAYDPRWINFDNGDYRVVITALDRRQGARHDIVFQLFPVDDMLSVTYAPGVPYLVAGEPAGVVGINAGGLTYHESCSAVPRKAAWSPLTSLDLPLPGKDATIDVSADLHERGRTLQAAIPIVVARNPEPGALGLFIKPDTWPKDAVVRNGEVPVRTRVLCAVKIRGVEPGMSGFELQIEPLAIDRSRLSRAQVNELVVQFENFTRLTSDPAWRFKSAQIQRTRDQRSLMLGIMDYLNLNARHSESLLMENNAGLAVRLLEHMDGMGGVNR